MGVEVEVGEDTERKERNVGRLATSTHCIYRDANGKRREESGGVEDRQNDGK